MKINTLQTDRCIWKIDGLELIGKKSLAFLFSKFLKCNLQFKTCRYMTSLSHWIASGDDAFQVPNVCIVNLHALTFDIYPS